MVQYTGSLYLAVSIVPLCWCFFPPLKLENWLGFWECRRKWTYTKFVYFIARYLPVLVETSVLVFLFFGEEDWLTFRGLVRSILLIGSELTPYFHFSSHDCYIWQVYQGISAGAIITTADTILILRGRVLTPLTDQYTTFSPFPSLCTLSWKSDCLYCGSMFLCFGDCRHGCRTRAWAAWHHLWWCLPCRRCTTYSPDLRVSVFPPFFCAFHNEAQSDFISSASSIIYQSFLFTLTVYKFLQALRSGWGHIPLVKLLMRDGTWAFFLLFCKPYFHLAALFLLIMLPCPHQF